MNDNKECIRISESGRIMFSYCLPFDTILQILNLSNDIIDDDNENLFIQEMVSMSLIINYIFFCKQIKQIYLMNYLILAKNKFFMSVAARYLFH